MRKPDADGTARKRRHGRRAASAPCRAADRPRGGRGGDAVGLPRGPARPRLADRRPGGRRQGDARLALRPLPVRQPRPERAGRARRARPLGRPEEPGGAPSRVAGASGLSRSSAGSGRRTRRNSFSEIRVDDIRDALQVFQMSAAFGGWRICLVDCAEDLNANGANALLKMIEEPPARSLILIVSHRPGQVLPTIRSRCRRLRLDPLKPGEIAEVVATLGPPWSEADPAAVARAAARANGSVREALARLSPDAEGVGALIDATLADLPHPDQRAVAKLAEALAGRASSEAFDAFHRALYEWLAAYAAQNRVVAARRLGDRPALGPHPRRRARDRGPEPRPEAARARRLRRDRRQRATAGLTGTARPSKRACSNAPLRRSACVRRQFSSRKPALIRPCF